MKVIEIMLLLYHVEKHVKSLIILPQLLITTQVEIGECGLRDGSDSLQYLLSFFLC